MDDQSKESTLQQRYIELLEKRVAQLEAAVKKAEDQSSSGSPDKDGETEAAGENGGRYRNILRKWDKNSGTHKDEVVGANFFLKQQSKDVAYTFRRVYNPDTGDKGAYSELDIEDPLLINILKKEIGKYPGVNFDSDIITMRNPFAALVHNWDKLNKRAEQEPDSQPTKDLVSLLERVKTAPELQDYFKVRDSHLASKVVNFDTLWTFFAPGTLVVARLFQNVPQILKVADSPIPWSTQYQYRYLKMWAWSWDWDGKKLMKVEYGLKFERFRGTKSIEELPFTPLSLNEDPEKLLAEARVRGLAFIKATARCKAGAGQMFRYDGLAFADQRKILSKQDKDEQTSYDEDGNEITSANNNPDEPPQPKLIPVKGEIIVDPDAFIQYGTGKPPLGELYTPENIYVDELQGNTEDYLEFADVVSKVDLDKELDRENDNFVIFPPRVLGYATREKIWGQFNLAKMREPLGKKEDLFDTHLQLDQKYKNLIRALVQSHELSNSNKTGKQVEDVVQDKGKGLVLLLHGPPGVGKTLTAETIAQATAKPLVVVSVAEIGLDASRAERNLERLFNLATKWEAILLVDEADVFLETRGATSSASRNALVSVLLRVLEYYRGIIILTTNRIKSIDIAVISRIHLAIRYEDLTIEQMRSIFKYFLDQLEPGCIANRESIDDFIESFGHHYGLNGRQIRNVVAAALAAARHQAKNPVAGKPAGDGRMTFKHLKSVCEMTRDFQEQLKENTRQQRYNNEVMRP